MSAQPSANVNVPNCTLRKIGTRGAAAPALVRFPGIIEMVRHMTGAGAGQAGGGDAAGAGAAGAAGVSAPTPVQRVGLIHCSQQIRLHDQIHAELLHEKSLQGIPLIVVKHNKGVGGTGGCSLSLSASFDAGVLDRFKLPDSTSPTPTELAASVYSERHLLKLGDTRQPEIRRAERTVSFSSRLDISDVMDMVRALESRVLKRVDSVRMRISTGKCTL